ncbi:unnamed protein product [Amoebophrya sp. A120]|nr:unnamed protein product [Amoebophrya sp. A120]|eukprot:GSA120T00001615001.1
MALTLDRSRLQEIERLANEVLMEQEELRERIRRADGIRQGLNALTTTAHSNVSKLDRSSKVREANVWLSTGLSDGDHFVRLSKKSAREKLEKERVRTQTEEKEKRAAVKKALKELHNKHPSSAEIAPGVLDLLIQQEAEEKKAAAEKKDHSSSASKSAQGVVRRDRLDYSQWNAITTSDSEDDDDSDM